MLKGELLARLRQLGCTDQTVRNVIRAFDREGLGCLEQKSSRPKTAKPELDEAKCEQVRALLHHSPRQFGKARSTWTLPLVAEVCQERGLTKALVSDETIRKVHILTENEQEIRLQNEQ